MSRLPFELFLALRYLRPKRTFVSIITLISVIGVMLGVAVLIIVISVMSGYDRDFREKILGFYAHIVVTQTDGPMTNYPAVERLITSNQMVRGISPFVISPVLVQTTGNDTNQPTLQDAPILRGVDPQSEGNISDLPRDIIAGEFDLSGRGLVVGSSFARRMGLHIGDVLSVYSTSEIRRMKAAYDRHEQVSILPSDYEVRGIFDAGYDEYNARFVLASLENAQNLCDLDDSVGGLFVMLHKPEEADAVKEQLERTLGPAFSVSTWKEQNSAILNAILVEKNLMFYIMFFIVIVAAFGITCTLITFVMMKTREIGLMKAVGVSSRQVMSVFLLQSLVISLFGIAAGVTLGFLAVHFRNDFLHLMNRLMGFELFPASIYGFGELPAVIIPNDIAIICGGSLLICLVAAILPAWHASKMNTVEALRHE